LNKHKSMEVKNSTKNTAGSAQQEILVTHFRAVLEFAERNTCTHEETHRGGAIWEICSYCGKKWADDEGGKPANAHDLPQVLTDARDFLYSLENDKSQHNLKHMHTQADLNDETLSGDIPAFPIPMNEGEVWDYEKHGSPAGMTLRQYAAIKLRVPKSGLNWLDAMISESQRNDVVLHNLQAILSCDKWNQLIALKAANSKLTMETIAMEAAIDFADAFTAYHKGNNA